MHATLARSAAPSFADRRADRRSAACRCCAARQAPRETGRRAAVLAGAALAALARARPALAAAEVWQEFSGGSGAEQWSIQLPPAFARESVPAVLEPGSTTVGASPRALPGFGPAPPANPLKGRFVSADGLRVVSVGVRRAADLRPTFLQVNDVSEFGGPDEAQALLVPPGARVTASSQQTHAGTSEGLEEEAPVERSYYLFEFTRGALHGVLVAAAKRGKVFVAILTDAAPDFDEAAAERLRAAARTFRVLGRA